MSALPVTCGGFLIAVLWMDLMFDVQVLRHRDGDLPAEVLASISAYYRRVTSSARPMGHLIGTVMLIALITLIVQMVRGTLPLALGLLSLALIAPPIALAGLRVVPNAIRLGRGLDSPTVQSELARAICRDHLICLGAVLAFVVLQLGWRF